MHNHVHQLSTTALRLRLLLALAILLAATLLPAALPTHAADLPPETYVQGIEPTMNAIGIFTVGDEGISNALPINFNFTYFGNSVDTFYIYSNGLITLGAGNNPDDSGFTALATPWAIPTASNPNNFIAAFWDDLDSTSSNGRYLYKTVGVAPNRKLIVQWTNTGFYQQSTPLGTFQIVLYEGSNEIQLQYRYLVSQAAQAHGSSAVVGIENATGTAGVEFSNGTASLNSGQAIRFTPSGSSYTMKATANYEGIVLGTSATPAPSSPLQSCPVNTGTGAITPTFSWADAGAGVTYRLIVDNDNTFASPAINATGLTSTNYTPGTPLIDGTTYYWSVIASNGTDSTWSEQWSFTASNTGLSPCAALLIAPTQQATGVSTSPTFSWGTAPNATSYHLIVSPNANLSTPAYDQSGISGTIQSVTGLTMNTVYYWKVIAVNTSGTASSAVRSFTTLAGPLLVTTSSDHGAATSYFVFAGQGFQPAESVVVAVDGRGVLTLNADANGRLTFVLYFASVAPARSFTITASSVAQAVQIAAAARQAQTLITIDPLAQVLPQPADPTLSQANALPTIYLPLTLL